MSAESKNILDLIDSYVVGYRIINGSHGALSHGLDLVLNGLLTRRNFWSIPGMLENYTIPKWKEFFEIRRANFEKILFIYFYTPGWNVWGECLFYSP